MAENAVSQADTTAGSAVFVLDRDGGAAEPSKAPPVEVDDWIEPILRQNAVWFCRLRWIVVAVLALVGLAGAFPAVLAPYDVTLTPPWPLVTAAILVCTNIIFVRWTRRAGKGHSVRLILWAQITTDLLVLTAVIHWLGSGLPAASFMYLFHIILACIVFRPAESLAVAGLAASFYLTCLLVESLGLLPRTSVVTGAGDMLDPVARNGFLAFSVGPMLLIWIVIWYLVSRLAGILHRREEELALTNLRLKASSEERAHHMLETTHQLKAPFASIHAHAQLLLGNYCGTLPGEARSVVEKISTRCMALSRQIQEMLQLANLRSQGQMPPVKENLELDALIEEAIARIEPTARQRGIRIEHEIQPVKVTAVADHLTMLLENLVVNAVNYSFNDGLVAVTCGTLDNGDAQITVSDQGIGIPPAKLPRIFDDYYRTEEAVSHNRSSTGLGLAIARHVAREIRATIKVESAQGRGSRFTLTIPTERPAAKHSN